MSSYGQAVKRFEERQQDRGAANEQVIERTNFTCAAQGCPNAGAIDDAGRPGTGRCYWHYREADPRHWPAITEQINNHFDSMRNWGEMSAELKARHMDEARKRAEKWRIGSVKATPAAYDDEDPAA